MPDSPLGPNAVTTPGSTYPTTVQIKRRSIPFVLIAAILACGGLELLGLQMIHLLASISGAVWLTGVTLVVLHIGQSILLVKIIKVFPLKQQWIWRAGLLGSVSLALLAAYGINGHAGSPAFPAALFAGCLGAFLGVIFLTSFRMGLWEDNFPPSPETMQAVYLRHRQEPPVPIHGSFGKRAFDILLAALGLLLSFPLQLLIILAIWWEDPGPVIFVKNSVGKGGKNFHQFKFRTMVRDAEKTTGPILANGEDDQRVLHFGRFLRKTALDELPQLINILTGEMSFVGPRPQRTVLVAGYLDQVPGYAKRHQIAPGLAGLAQVAGSYFISPEEKLRWDLIYIERACLSFDLKLILLAFMIVFWYRWQKDWDEHTPDRWLKIQRKDL